jgi:glycerate 2-kinase
MRVLIAPDCFGGTLTAPEAAEAIAAGWRSGAPDDELTLCPLADGGPGFVDVLHAALGGHLRHRSVSGPLGSSVDAVWLEHEGTAYIECAQACGLTLVPKGERKALAATTVGVGELVRHALESDVHTVVVGLGGSATTDGGAGMFRELGAVPVGADGEPLPVGGGPLVDTVRLEGRVDLRGVRLVAASDVENPLLGRHGAARVFGPQKGADDLAVRRLEKSLTRWADMLAEVAGRDVRDEPGAGAAGGLGAALAALGAELVPGASYVLELLRFRDRARGVDVAITGEGKVDGTTLRGKAPGEVARICRADGVRCVVFAGRVEAELEGVELHELSGSPERAREDLVELGAALAV